MTKQHTDPRVERLRREAWQLKKSTPGMKHHAALQAIAEREKFRNWGLLVRHYEANP